MRIACVSVRDGLVAALMVGWSMACGGDDAAPSATGTGTTQTGGSGGTSADGGAGTAGGGTGGAGGTAGAGASAGVGGKADSGPLCTPRDEVKPPVNPTVQVQSSCTSSACGGPIGEGQWAAT